MTDHPKEGSVKLGRTCFLVPAWGEEHPTPVPTRLPGDGSGRSRPTSSIRRCADGGTRLCQALAAEGGLMVARAQMAERLEEAYIATLGALAAALEAKDAYTNDHASQIADIAGAVCEHLGIAPAETRMIRLGALLHDIGKIGVPEAILRKPGPLDEDERRRMQQHPDI